MGSRLFALMDIEVRGLRDFHQGFRTKLILFPDRCYRKQDVAKEDTHLYRFREAVKERQEARIELLRPLFEQMGVDIDSA